MMLMTLVTSPVISQMPMMPEPASATAIGTPASRHTSRISMGSAATMELFQNLRALRGARRFLGEQQRLAPAQARQICDHQQRQREEADRDEAIGRPDQDRQRADLGVIMQAAPALDGGRPQEDQTEQQRHEVGEIVR